MAERVTSSPDGVFTLTSLFTDIFCGSKFMPVAFGIEVYSPPFRVSQLMSALIRILRGLKSSVSAIIVVVGVLNCAVCDR